MPVQHNLPSGFVSHLERLSAGSERQIAATVRELSDGYVGKTSRAPIGSAGRARAYAAYYGPVNALKVKIILEELGRRYPALWTGDGPLRVLDIGAGPGSATAGVCLAFPDRRIEAVWVDEDSSWTDEPLTGYWKSAGSLSVVRQTGSVDSAGRDSGRFSIAVAANVVVELEGDDQERTGLLDRVFRRSLGPAGVALIVEPALREPTRDLHRIRDGMVRLGWRVLAPCLGEASCPMLKNERDWCHETRDWLQPDFHHRIDQFAGLKKDALRFSFLALSLEPPLAVPEGVARIVSEIRREKGRTRIRTCDAEGRLADWDVLERVIRGTPGWGEVILGLERGDLVKIPHARGGRLSPGDPFGRL